MATPVLILGESGSGKSFSLKNLDPASVLLIKCVNKPLPFRSQHWKPFNIKTGEGSVVYVPRWDLMLQAFEEIPNYNKPIIIVDDFQYIMGFEFMYRACERGYDKFSEIGQHGFRVIKAATDIQNNSRVYFLSHTETEQNSGKVKIKTIGNLVDDKIVLEGMFTIVLKTLVEIGNYQFVTQTNGNDTVKSPHEMFDPIIPNDLALVDQTICNYWGHQSQSNQNRLEYRR